MICVKYEPSQISMSEKTAVPVESTGTVMSSITQNVNDCFANVEELKQTGPAFNVTALNRFDPDASTEKLILAFDDFLERGRYPIFLAIDTTFSLELHYQEILHSIPCWHCMKQIYVLYANVSRMVDKFDPSKS